VIQDGWHDDAEDVVGVGESEIAPQRRGFELAPAHFLIVGVLGLLLLAIGVGQWLTSTRSTAAETGPRQAPRVGMPAPDFALIDLATGERVSLLSLRGKPVWINFWATWCEACRVEMPAMQKVYEQYKDDGLVILGVDAQESPEAVSKYTTEGGYTWTFLIDTDGSVLNEYFVFAIPTHFFIGRDGVIKGIEVGAPPGESVERHLKEITK
jgi:thiol-disulfide isomerase/thioredoxin